MHMWSYSELFLADFVRDFGLSSVKYNSYLPDFSHLEITEAARCTGFIIEAEKWDADMDKTPKIDGLP